MKLILLHIVNKELKFPVNYGIREVNYHITHP